GGAEHNLERERVDEIRVEERAVARHLSREDAVLAEIPERGHEDREREPEREDAEALRAQLARHDDVERERRDLRARVREQPVAGIRQDAPRARSHQLSAYDFAMARGLPPLALAYHGVQDVPLKR